MPLGTDLRRTPLNRRLEVDAYGVVGPIEYMLQEAKYLKQMYRFAREMKAISRKYFLWQLVQELFDVSCEHEYLQIQGQVDERCQLFCFHWTEDGKYTFWS